LGNPPNYGRLLWTAPNQPSVNLKFESADPSTVAVNYSHVYNFY